jgi:hypothetical protein
LATPEHNKRHLASMVHDAPMASTETLDVGISEHKKRPQQMPPQIPPPRMDLTHPKPSAPPLHLLNSEVHRSDQRFRQGSLWQESDPHV